MNIYNIYDLKSNLKNLDSTLENCLFGAVKLTKNNDIYKYEYAGYGIGFDSKGTFSCPGGSFAQNVIMFGADMSSSVHPNSRTKGILILGERFTQRLEDTTLYPEKMYSINFTATIKKFCLSLHYDGANSYLFVKAADSELVANPLCLGNISEDFSVVNMKKLDFMVLFLTLVLITE